MTFDELIDRVSTLAKTSIEKNHRALDEIAYGLLRYGTLSEANLCHLAGDLARRWESGDVYDAPAPTSVPPHRTLGPRAHNSRRGHETREMIPGLRYSDAAPMTVRERR
jgi:hypothetical protein